MRTETESSKAKIAKRVIEIFDYFADGHSSLTVMEIVGRYGRPQSSTSELLAALSGMGLLYRDKETRRFFPTPRMASLGIAGQPELISSGRLFSLMDRLAQTSRQSVALFGILGSRLQVLRWTSGLGAKGLDLSCGATCSLVASAAGQLLLSTLGEDTVSKVLWRLRAEVTQDGKFDLADAKAHVMRLGQFGCATGQAGIAPHAGVSAVLLPELLSGQPVALGVVYAEHASVDPDAIVETLRFNIEQHLSSRAVAKSASVRSRTLIAV